MVAVSLVAVVLALSSSLCVTHAEAVTPVQKVVELLKKIEAQVSKEGADEAAQYDKYACFCKEQADGKNYAIEKSDKKIKKLETEIAKLDADIADLNSDITSLTSQITELEGEIKTADELRATELEAYTTEEKDLADAITALKGAIKALKESKGEMTKTKLDLAQVGSLVAKVFQSKAFAPASPLGERVRQATALLQEYQPVQKQYAAKHVYEYRSNDIIGTLQELLVNFKDNKKELDEKEFSARSASEKKILGLSNEKKFAEKEKTEKEEVVAQKEEELNTATEDKGVETEAKDADAKFLDEVTEGCKTEAGAWDKRSTTRAGELTAIAKAIEVLQSGVAPNYSANKQLSGLLSTKEVGKSVSFLQVYGSSSEAAMVQRVIHLVQGEANRLKSSVLAGLAMKLDLGSDKFAKVKGLIEDLIKKLEAEATSEADQKTFCDENMAKALDSRDQAKLDGEEAAETISQKTADKEEAQQDIQSLMEKIAELNKGLNEATQLRATEKADNEKTLAEANEGKSAVEFAMNVLKEFYDGAAFLQKKKQRQDPFPEGGHDGKAFSDLAPEAFSDEYKGKQDASKGILGLLEVILGDFEATLTSVGDAEEAAQSEFTKFEEDTSTDIQAKEDDKSQKEADVATLEEELLAAKQATKDAKRAHEDGIAEIEKLKAMCVAGDESWAEKKEARKQEIASLKEAMKLLDGFKKD